MRQRRFRYKPPRPTFGLVSDASCIAYSKWRIDGYFHGKCEHQVLDLEAKTIVRNSRIYPQGTINLSEFLGILEAVRYLHDRADVETPVYSDSAIALNWYHEQELRSALPVNEFTYEIIDDAQAALDWLKKYRPPNPVLKWETKDWGENPADFLRK